MKSVCVNLEFSNEKKKTEKDKLLRPRCCFNVTVDLSCPCMATISPARGTFRSQLMKNLPLTNVMNTFFAVFKREKKKEKAIFLKLHLKMHVKEGEM